MPAWQKKGYVYDLNGVIGPKKPYHLAVNEVLLMSPAKNKPNKTLRATVWGGLILFLSGFITGLAGVANLIPAGSGELNGLKVGYGMKASILNYFRIWVPFHFPSEVAYLGEILILFAMFLFAVTTLIAVIKKEYLRIFPSFMLFLGICFLPYLAILVVPMIQMRVMTAVAMLILSIATLLNILAIIILLMPVIPLIRIGWNACAGIITNEPKEEKEPRIELPGEERFEAAPGLTQEEVRSIAEEVVENHVDKLHCEEPVVKPVIEPLPEPEPEMVPEPEPEPEPAPEPEPEPVVEEEPEPEEAEEEKIEVLVPSNSEPGNPFGSGRRKGNFETRLKASEADIRHKYYDLRDYICWYGVKNRISIPGDTFSLHRERFAFITLSGKHIKLYLAINPDTYATSPIPVERVDSKKFEDLPTLIRVRSDLSYRRAKQIIDDVMAAKGMPRPEGPEPKETQD